MKHHCGLVIENVLERDQGTWECNLKLMDEKSSIHTINKVIDLNVRNRRQSSKHHQRDKKKRRGDQFSLNGGNGDLYGSGDGSGDGYGDEVSRGLLQTQLCFRFKIIKNYFNPFQGPITISRGEVAQTIYDWILVKTVAFDFKITSRSRGRRFIAVLSDIGGYRCCSIRNAMFSVFLGNQTLLLYN